MILHRDCRFRMLRSLKRYRWLFVVISISLASVLYLNLGNDNAVVLAGIKSEGPVVEDKISIADDDIEIAAQNQKFKENVKSVPKPDVHEKVGQVAGDQSFDKPDDFVEDLSVLFHRPITNNKKLKDILHVDVSNLSSADSDKITQKSGKALKPAKIPQKTVPQRNEERKPTPEKKVKSKTGVTGKSGKKFQKPSDVTHQQTKAKAVSSALDSTEQSKLANVLAADGSRKLPTINEITAKSTTGRDNFKGNKTKKSKKPATKQSKPTAKLDQDKQARSKKYEPTWDSIDSRPLPPWFDEAKLGIFIHWGVFSVPSYITEWFWWEWQGPTPEQAAVDFMKKNYPPNFTYADFAKMFTTEFFDPNQWAELFQESGAKYIVLTSKHHEGFTNWPSKVSWNWNSMDNGPHRDLVGELASAIRNKTDLRYGLYHSLFEWFNPKYINDKKSNFTTTSFVSGKTMPELHEIVNQYKPDIVWSDGDFGPDVYWNSTGFLAWLYNDSPVKDYVVTNDRWGTGIRCHHGGYYSCSDKYNPGKLQNHKWENCMTIDRYSWGYRRNAKVTDYLTIEELLSTLASTISCGGNMLMNIGPTRDGIIAPIFQERLRQMGSWLKVNGEAVYSSKPWRSQNDSLTDGIWYTTNNNAVYAFVLSWPKNNEISLGSPLANDDSTVMMLGLEKAPLKWSYLNLQKSNGVRITFPDLPRDKLPCKWAWVLKLVGFN